MAPGGDGGWVGKGVKKVQNLIHIVFEWPLISELLKIELLVIISQIQNCQI